MVIHHIAVYCGSAVGRNPAYAAGARRLGTLMAERSIGLICGGGGIGLMKEIADAVLVAGGQAIGVIPEPMVRCGLAHAGLTRLHVVATMHERKEMMARIADAFIALPGGYGTFEELLETLTWNQIGIHHKPCGVLNVAGYYDPMLAQFDRATNEGLLQPEWRKLILSDPEPAELLDRLLTATPQRGTLWDGEYENPKSGI